ncbi:hypothetical protein ECZC06_56280 [Escherichia coli]|nr:hypothetical protein ECZC06_56280 [Escherichia coli]
MDTTKTKTLDLELLSTVLEPEEFSNRFIVAPEFNRRKRRKRRRESVSDGMRKHRKTVITAEEGRKIELMYQSVMALPPAMAC